MINYVSPTVWAWRPGRAPAMRAYVDCVLALLPFEPEAHARLGGPRCVYVGHPLVERLAELRPNPDEARRRAASPPLVLALPGSRRSVIARLMADFGAAIAAAEREAGPFEIVLPTLPHVEGDVRALAARWPRPPRIVVGEQRKVRRLPRRARGAGRIGHCHARARARRRTAGRRLQGFRRRGAVASAYHTAVFGSAAQSRARRSGDSRISAKRLPTSGAGDGARRACRDGPARSTQLAALDKLDARMRLDDGGAPSVHAASAVLETIARRNSA